MQGAGVNSTDSKLEDKIAEMRRLFDESFAIAPAGNVTESEAMLAIAVEGEHFALRGREISGLSVSNEKIVPVPSRVPELLGLTGIRGVVVPVFSLPRLLGFDSLHGQTRWLVFCGEVQTPIALAFETMERLFEATGSDIFVREEPIGRHRHVNATVSEGTTLRGVISIPTLVEYIKARGTTERRQSKTLGEV
jgi:chemotaxis signal transduction protein